jgi:hypothetical protein
MDGPRGWIGPCGWMVFVERRSPRAEKKSACRGLRGEVFVKKRSRRGEEKSVWMDGLCGEGKSEWIARLYGEAKCACIDVYESTQSKPSLAVF